MSTTTIEAPKTVNGSNLLIELGIDSPKPEPKKPTTKVKAKKVNKGLALKKRLNQSWKDDTLSLSGIVRFVNSPKGKKHVIALIDHYNKVNGSVMTIGNINTKNIVKYAKANELILKDGSKRVHFSLWRSICFFIGRYSKANTVKA
jgi:hypothetical protein